MVIDHILQHCGVLSRKCPKVEGQAIPLISLQPIHFTMYYAKNYTSGVDRFPSGVAVIFNLLQQFGVPHVIKYQLAASS
jgi:hypothetical protein